MLFRRRQKPVIESVSFDTTGWELREQSETHCMWMTNTHDAVLLRYSTTPPTYTYDLTGIDAARQFYDMQSIENGGAMLSVDFVKSDGIDLVKGVFKYRSPEPESMAMYYVGILTMLYRDFFFQINTESLEVGTTGGREAAIALAQNPTRPPKQDLVQVKSGDDLFRLMRSNQVRRSPADDEKYDESFPNHPLSKVRRLQSQILASLKITDVVRNSEPYRIQDA